MSFFKFGKNRDVVDLGERYRKQQERMQASEPKTEENENEEVPFAFFGNQDVETGKSTNVVKDGESGEVLDLSDSIGARRKKLTKRILDMTSKMEDLSNQVYHLQQRIEVLEKKLDVNRFE